MTRPLQSGVLLALVIVLARPVLVSAASTPSSGDGSQTGDGSTAYTGLAQAPEANLFVGGATTGIPILVPPGRRSLTPALSLSYASNAGPSPYGHGWDLPLPRVQRATKHGSLLCSAELNQQTYHWDEVADPMRDEFVLSMPSATIECTRGTNGICVPHVEEAFIRITYDANTKTFVVWDKSGTKFTFGEANRATDQATGEPGAGAFNLPARTGNSLTNEFALVGADDPFLHPQCEYIYSWALTSVEDPYGNRMEIRYRLLSGVLHPHKIIYGGNDAASLAHPFTVAFGWEDRPAADRPSFSIGGFRAIMTKRLDSIAITYTSQPVRTYTLTYDDNRHGRQSMLAGVTVTGTDGTSVLLRADGQPAAATFAYRTLSGSDAPGFDDKIQRPLKPVLGDPANALRWYDNGETKREVFDINGDGFADLVDTASCAGNSSWKVYPGSRNGFSDVATCWYLPDGTLMNVIRGKADPPNGVPVKRATLDINGDGIADYIDARSTPWVVYKGTKTSAGGSWGFAAGVPWPAFGIGVQGIEPQSGGSVITRDLIDMNGDGRVDLVDAGGSSTTYWSWYANTGSGFSLEDQRFNTGNTGIPGLHLSFTDENNGLEWGTFDINGDGLPDYVQAGAPAWTVCISTGREFGPCEQWSAPTFGLAGFVRKSIDSQSLDTVRDFFDLNGDGLPDIVDKSNWSTNGGRWQVLFNRGGGFDQTIVTWRGPRFIRNGSSGGGGVMEDTFDLDGDGLVDHVIFDGTDGSDTNHFGVRRLFDDAWKTAATGDLTVGENPGGLRPDLLVLTESGSGGSTLLSYRPSTQWNNTALPFNIWTLTDLVHRDGLCPLGSMLADGFCTASGHEVGTTITYASGLYDAAQREFRGFGTVQTEALVANDATPHTATLTFYNQTPTLSGKVAQTWTWDASGANDSMFSKPLSATGNTWECANPFTGTVLASCPVAPAGDVWVRLKTTSELTFGHFNIGEVKTSVTSNESWHSCTASGGGGAKFYGNVAHARRGAANAGPQLHTHTEYACRDDGNGYLVDRPVHVLVQDEANTVLEERWFWYDGHNADGDFGKVDHGGATRSDSLVDVNDTAPAGSCAQTPATSGGA